MLAHLHTYILTYTYTRMYLNTIPKSYTGKYQLHCRKIKDSGTSCLAQDKCEKNTGLHKTTSTSPYSFARS